MVRTKWIVLVLALLAAATPAAAQEAGSIRLFFSGGFQTAEASIDAARSVDFDAAVQLGGGLALGIHDNIAFRVDAATVTNSGFESGVVNAGVELRRRYLGASLEASFPVTPLVTPYGFAGFGVVNLFRSGDAYYTDAAFSAPVYTWEVSEVAVLGGAGVKLPVMSGLGAYAQVSGWWYLNQAIDEYRIDPVFSVGIDYVLPF